MKTKTLTFEELMSSDFISNKAESHFECWKHRYCGKRKKDALFDLEMNHDDSLEIEDAEEELGRKLTDKEITILTTLFHKAVIKLI